MGLLFFVIVVLVLVGGLLGSKIFLFEILYLVFVSNVVVIVGGSISGGND